MATYSVEPIRENLHGTFSREFPPILTIEPGDTVVYRTLDAAWNIEPRNSAVPEDRPRKLEPRDPERDAGHCLDGPVAIRGAEPGMTLEVRVEEIKVGTWGWTVAGGWKSPENVRLSVDEAPEFMHLWALDQATLTGRNQNGHVVKLRSFMGVMGMPPNEAGSHPTAPPRVMGGNMDCKEIIAGTTLYLPIAVEEGLFSVGDGHALQGDGEVSTTAIECPMDRVVLRFDLRTDLPIKTPRLHTPEAWMTLGFNEDLDEASFLALDEMLSLMRDQHSLEYQEALALASLLVDLRVTQMVNGVRGVHAVLRHDALRTV